MRIMRQADYYGLHTAAEEEEAPEETSDFGGGLGQPPAGLEDALKGPGIQQGLNQAAGDLGGGPSPTDEEGWPQELPGDKIMNALGDVADQVQQFLPTGKAAALNGRHPEDSYRPGTTDPGLDPHWRPGDRDYTDPTHRPYDDDDE